MDKRTSFSEIANIALLYRYIYEGTNMISYEKIVNFEKCINKNLEIMGSNYYKKDDGFKNDEIYFIATNEIGEKYLVMYPNINLEITWKKIISNLSLDILLATRLNNAFKEIDLDIDNNINDSNKNKKLKKK